MSESSDSFHLLADNPTDVETLLRSAGVRGAILLLVEERFVAFLVEAKDGPNVIAHNTGLLVYYQFAEDYSSWVGVYQGRHRIAELVYEHEGLEDEIPDSARVERQDRGAAIRALVEVGLIDEAAVGVLESLDTQGRSRDWGPAVAAILRLRPVSWLNGEDLLRPAQLLDSYDERQ